MKKVSPFGSPWRSSPSLATIDSTAGNSWYQGADPSRGNSMDWLNQASLFDSLTVSRGILDIDLRPKKSQRRSKAKRESIRQRQITRWSYRRSNYVCPWAMSIPFSAHIVFRHQASTHNSLGTSAFRKLYYTEFLFLCLRTLSLSKSGTSWNNNRITTSASIRQTSRLAVFSDREWVMVL
jgi:hypothetical protein